MDSLIFDVDGTLWDSTPIVAKAWTDVLKEKEGIDLPITDVMLKGLFGRLLPDIAAVLFPEKSEAEQLRLIDLCCQAEHEALIAHPAPLYEGMEEALQTLCQKIPLFIVSNCQAGYIEVFLTGTKTEKYFQGHLCPGDSGVAKAENIQIIAREYGLKSPYYLGDTKGDYEACVKAGVPFILAGYGFGSVPEAKYRIEQPKDLLHLAGSLP